MGVSLEGQVKNGHLVVPLPTQVPSIVRFALQEHGEHYSIRYLNTGCGLEGGFYAGEGGPHLTQELPGGLRRNPTAPFIHITEEASLAGVMVIRDYSDLKPEVQQALPDILQRVGIDLVIEQSS